MSNSNIQLTEEAKIQIAKLLGFDISPDKMDDYHQILDDAIRKTAALNINNVKNLVPTGLENPVGDFLIETQIQTQKNEVTKNIQPNDLVTYHGRNLIDNLFDIVEDLPTRNNVNQIKTTLIDDNAITDPQLRGDIKNQKNQILKNLSEAEALQYLNSGPRQYNAFFDDLQTDGAVANVLRNVINSSLDDFIEPTKTNLLTKNLEIPEFINRYGAGLFQNILIKELSNADTGSIDFFIDYVTQVQIGRASFLGDLMVNNTPGVDSISNNQIELTNKGKDAEKYIKYTTKDVGKDINLDNIRQVPDTTGSDEYPVEGYFVIGDQSNFNYSEQINKFSSKERIQVDIQNDIQLPNQRTSDGYLINLGDPTNSAGNSLTPFIGQPQFTKNDLTIGFNANGGFVLPYTFNIVSDLASETLPTTVQGDSELGKEGYIFLKQTIQNRIDRAQIKEIAGRTANSTDAINDPLGAGVALLKGQAPAFTLSYDITTLPGFLTTFDVVRRVSGIDPGISPIPEETRLGSAINTIKNSINNLFGGNIFGGDKTECDTNPDKLKPPHIPRNKTLLRYTSTGQLFTMYNTLSYNKFSPEWLRDPDTLDLFSTLIPKPKSNLYIDSQRAFSLGQKLGGILGLPVKEPDSNYNLNETDPVRQNDSPTPLANGTTNKIAGKLSDDFVEAENWGRISTISLNSANNFGKLVPTYTDIYWQAAEDSDFGKSGGIRIYDNRVDSLGEPLPDQTGELPVDGTVEISNNFTFNGDSILCSTQSLANRNDVIGDVVRHQTTRIGSMSKGNAVNVWDKTTFQKTNEYCRVWTKDKGYNEISDLVRKGYTRGARGLMTNVKYTTLDKNGIPIIAPYKNDDELNEVTAKRYMLSIENLAWRGAKVFLPCGEIGPNGGRIMWFPPYGINFTDNGTANWTENSFMGRPEPIYTYNNTTRGGTLDFDLVVDHPSIVNHFNSGTEFNPQGYGTKPDELEAFFADCINYPIENLLDKYKTFNATELESLKSLLNKNLATLDLIYSGTPRIYFENDLPGNCTEQTNDENCGPNFKWGVNRFDQEYNTYKSQYITYRNNNSSEADKSEVDKFFDGSNSILQKGYEEINGLINLINSKIIEYIDKGSIVSKVKMNIETNTSLLNKKNNTNLSARRFNTLENYIKTKIENANTGRGIIVEITSTKEKDAATSNVVEVPVIDKNDPNYVDPNNEAISVYSPGAFKFRYAAVKPETIKIVLANDEEIPLGDTLKQETSDVQKQVDYLEEIKKRLNAGVLQPFNRECEMFEQLQQNSSFLYDSLIEKLRYFHPAFHSTTPEGFNSRLTFLNQCLRPGDSIDTTVVTNTVFGPPPICILRIGDFYHTKIAINSINISYVPLWDMNYEGIGMQPLTAKVSMSFNYIGGSSLGGPINELQNALSFNFYANTSIYDSRAKLSKEEQDIVDQANIDRKNSDVVEIKARPLPNSNVPPLLSRELPKNPTPEFYIPKRNNPNAETSEVPPFIGGNQEEQNPVDLETR